MSTIKLNHVGIVTPDLDNALSFWRDALGLPVLRTEHNDEEAVDIVFLQAGEGSVELVAPTTTDSGIAKYLDKRGAGMHHTCVEVDDIESAMAQLREAGIDLINDAPRARHDGTLYAFVHPRSTGGVLVELYATPR